MWMMKTRELRLKWMFDSEQEIDGAPPPGRETPSRKDPAVELTATGARTVLFGGDEHGGQT
jgi:hypothetical protein